MSLSQHVIRLIKYPGNDLQPQKMASGVSWNCQLCLGSYISLKDLVSHVRAAHSSGVNINYVCGVEGCPRIFKRPITWYKHIISTHSEEYHKVGNISSGSSSEEENALDDDGALDDGPLDDDSFIDHDQMDYTDQSQAVSEPSMVVGKLIKMKEYHRLSHAAVDDMLEFVDSVCNDVLTKAPTIHCFGEGLDMDLTSLYQELPEIFESLTSPLASLKTFKQQLYIANNLPYVVCYNNINSTVHYYYIIGTCLA